MSLASVIPEPMLSKAAMYATMAFAALSSVEAYSDLSEGRRFDNHTRVLLIDDWAPRQVTVRPGGMMAVRYTYTKRRGCVFNMSNRFVRELSDGSEVHVSLPLRSNSWEAGENLTTTEQTRVPEDLAPGTYKFRFAAVGGICKEGPNHRATSPGHQMTMQGPWIEIIVEG